MTLVILDTVVQSLRYYYCYHYYYYRQITTPVPHHSVLQAGRPSCRPTNRIKALKANYYYCCCCCCYYYYYYI